MKINTRKSSNNRLLILLFEVVFVFILGIFVGFSNSNSVQHFNSELIFLFFLLIIMILLLNIAIFKYKLDIFEPFGLITILYIFIFAVTPIILITNNDVDCYGAYVMDGCFKGTAVFLVSYIFFFFGYYLKPIRDSKEVENYSVQKESTVLPLAIIVWFASFVLYFMTLIKSGKSIVYILSVGTNGTAGTSDAYSGFLINISLMMVPCLTYVMELSKNKSLKIILFALTTISFLNAGYRYMLVVLVGTIAVTKYQRKGKRPSPRTVLLLMIVLVILFSALSYIRFGVRHGSGTQSFVLNSNAVIHMLESNFDIYKPFYGLVNQVPSRYPHTLGYGMIVETLVMFIPRSIWPGKPTVQDSCFRRYMTISTNSYASNVVVMRWPNIAEYYMEFGIIGCLVIMFLLGLITMKITKLYRRNKNNLHKLILYAVSYSVLFQLVISGYTPQQFYIVLFLVIPELIFSLIDRKKLLRKGRRL